MIYSNIYRPVDLRPRDYGLQAGIAIGERAPDCYEHFLHTPDGFDELESDELIEEFTIGTTRSGYPRVTREEDGELYLILSSGRGYSRNSRGVVQVFIGTADGEGNVAERIELPTVVARAKSKCGGSSGAGWDTVIVKARENDYFRVRWAGSSIYYPSTIYAVIGGMVHEIALPQIANTLKSLDVDPPFSLTIDDRGVYSVNPDEWHTL